MRLLLAAALLAACQKPDPGPPCGQIVDHMLDVTKQQLPGHDSQELGNRAQMIAQCEQRKMPAATRKCLVAAKTLGDLAECRAKDKPAPTRPLSTDTPGSAAAPRPAGSAAAPSANP